MKVTDAYNMKMCMSYRLFPGLELQAAPLSVYAVGPSRLHSHDVLPQGIYICSNIS
jgi:hypothetical protein